MQPATLDNYGGDACSLLCLPVSPPVLVIANRTGNIHHAVLLPRAATDDSDDSDVNPNIADDLEVCRISFLLVVYLLNNTLHSVLAFESKFDSCRRES